MLLALLLAGLASAQSPDDAWRTVETDHYRVHYPVEFEVWALRAAARLDDGRERVVEIVGFDPQQKVDVLVMDPVAEANAMALPLTRTPRMVLWTHPPEPDSVIGHYTDWTDELILHEDTHLVHMLRPSRAPLPGLFYGLVGVGPIAIKAPRWVTEGYATVAEGQLTGAGRPYSDLRIAILRRWAQEGALPTYGQLAADGESFMGMSMAYLAGSAYLQWLVDNSHEDALRDLWARMSARQDRSFDKAFEGVFGDSPRALYERFTAELTWASMGIERDVEPVEGELFRELSQYTDLPVISPDGTRVAYVRRYKSEPPRVEVVQLAVNDEALEERAEAREEQLAKDPQDVLAVDPEAQPHKVDATLPSRGGSAPERVRFMPDGERMLVVKKVIDGGGVALRDLYLWDIEAGGLTRVTRRANLRDPDPAPSGEWAIAVETRHGITELVRVDLATGARTTVVAGDVEVVWAQPRVSPDGASVASMRHANGLWELVVVDVASGQATALPSPGHGFLAHPTWSPDGGSVLASMGQGGFVDVYRFGVDGAEPERLTRSRAAAFGPAVTPDGAELMYLAFEPHGLDLRRLELGVGPVAEAPPEAAAAVVERPEPAEAAPAEEASGQTISRPEGEEPVGAAAVVERPAEAEEGAQEPSEGGEEPTDAVADAAESETAGVASDVAELVAVLPEEPALAVEVDLTPYRLALRQAPDVMPAPLREEPVAEPRRYGLGRMEPGIMLSDTSSVDRQLLGLGVRLGDVVGRFDAVALGGVDIPLYKGDQVKPAGSLAIAWRRLPFDVVATGYHLPAAGLSDVDRTGGTLAFAGDHRWLGGSFAAGVAGNGGVVGDVTRIGGSAFVSESAALLWSDGALFQRARVSGAVGSSDDGVSSGVYQSGRGELAVGLAVSDLAFIAELNGGLAGGPTTWDALQLGGLASSFAPDEALAERIYLPALAHAELMGSAYLADVWSLVMPGGLELFLERHRLWDGDGAVELVPLFGAQVSQSLPPTPLAKVPALSIEAGLAYPAVRPVVWQPALLRGWAALTVRP